MSLQICLDEDCQCLHHLLLDLLKKGENGNSKMLLEEYIINFRNLADNSGRTLLHYAVQYNNSPMVQYLINKGCNINARDQLEATPLTTAIANENFRMIELLFKNNADLCEPVDTLQMVLCRGIHSFMIRGKRIYQSILQLMYQRLNADFLSEKREKVVSLLRAEDSAKLVAVVFGLGSLTNFVLNNNYPIDFKESMGGCTALHCAVMFGRMRNAKILIDHGANVNALNNMEYAPFSYYSDHCEIVDENFVVLKKLVRQLTCPSVRDYGRKNMERLIAKRSKFVVKAILESGIDLNMYFCPGVKSLLRLLLENGDPNVLNLLDELGIDRDVNERIVTNKTVEINYVTRPLVTTVLMKALKTRCVRKIKFLLTRGADANKTPIGTDVALSTMIFYSTLPEKPRVEVEIMELLLQHTSDFRIVDNNKWGQLCHLHRSRNRRGTKVILAHLALLEALDLSPLTDVDRQSIESDAILKAQYDLCIRQLEEMKIVKVDNKVSLFDLLVERDEKRMAGYVRDQEFILVFNHTMECTFLDPHYYNTLHRKISKAIDQIGLELKAALALGLLTGLCNGVHDFILYKIIRHLMIRDMKNLCQVIKKGNCAN